MKKIPANTFTIFGVGITAFLISIVAYGIFWFLLLIFTVDENVISDGNSLIPVVLLLPAVPVGIMTAGISYTILYKLLSPETSSVMGYLQRAQRFTVIWISCFILLLGSPIVANGISQYTLQDFDATNQQLATVVLTTFFFLPSTLFAALLHRFGPYHSDYALSIDNIIYVK